MYEKELTSTRGHNITLLLVVLMATKSGFRSARMSCRAKQLQRTKFKSVIGCLCHFSINGMRMNESSNKITRGSISPNSDHDKY